MKKALFSILFVFVTVPALVQAQPLKVETFTLSNAPDERNLLCRYAQSVFGPAKEIRETAGGQIRPDVQILTNRNVKDI